MIVDFITYECLAEDHAQEHRRIELGKTLGTLDCDTLTRMVFAIPAWGKMVKAELDRRMQLEGD